jgi:predicted ATPase/class 3 adenylate cyclase/tRNA A-37 threonylcarbamoyl transferase component Bud32
MEKPKYKITEQLHIGSRFTIYRGQREGDEVHVILKMFKNPYPSARDLSRLRTEFSIVQHLKHPNIVSVPGLEFFGNRLALVREDIQGENLAAYLKSKAQLNLETFFPIAIQLAKAIQALHRQRIIHKKISSSNVLVNAGSGQIKLTGFSLATEMTREALQPNAQDVFEAELAYISPEQTGRMNRNLDYRTDFYSIGAVYYELLTGQTPFVSNDPMELVHCHIALQPKAPNQLRPDIPSLLSQLVLKLLAKNEDDRYQSADGLLFDLEYCYELFKTNTELKEFSLGSKDISDQFRIPAKLYGRNEELDQLMQAFHQAENGSSEVFMVGGYSGVGKSRLVSHLQKLIAEQKGFFIAGKFDQFKRDVPLSALLAAFRTLIRQLLSENEKQIAQWRDQVIEAVGVSGQVIIDVVPEVELLIGPQPATAELPPAEANNRFNQVLNRFVRIFSKPEHPLCLFIDDLQWIDPATRQWMETQLTDQSLGHFLLIGAYRDNEVTASHPLMLMLDRLNQSGATIKKIHLEPLNLPTLTQMVADTLATTPGNCIELAKVIYQKTNGNPFFTRQCLLSLYESGAIYFVREHQSWAYDLDKVRKAEISDNVVDLMVQLIQRLPEKVQNILKLAACIGNQFNLQTLSLVSEEDVGVINSYLTSAVQHGLIVPFHSWHKEYIEEFTFLHDRVQQAALSLLPEPEKKTIRLQIGRLLLKGIENIENDEKIYDVADHLNSASDLITDDDEQLKLVHVNLAAGKRAKKASAYEPAKRYITQAMDILPKVIWDKPSPLTAELLLQRAESEHLCGNDDVAENLYDQSLLHATGIMEKARIYQRKIHYYTNLRKFKQAYQTGREAVLPLGVRLPSKFIPPLFVKDLILYRFLLGRRKIKDIINIPEMSDERLKMAILLMSTFARAAYQIRPELCVAVCTRMVNVCLRHGNTEGGFIGFVALGPIFLGAILKQRQTGFEMGQLTLALVEKYKSVAFKAETHFVVGYFSMPWRRPAIEMERYWQIAYESGLQTGDFFHTSCACCGTVQSYYMRGMHFDEIFNASDRYLEFLQRINNNEAILTLQAVRQSMRNLRGQTISNISYSDETFDEDDYIKNLDGFGSRHFAHYYFINKMQTLYLWNEYDKAYEVSLLSDRYLKDSPGMMHTAEHYFYKALIICALFPKSDGKQRRQWMRTLQKINRQFKKYSAGCPPNFIHKAQLLAAEICLIRGAGTEAENLYYASVESATKYGYINIHALANERLTRFYYSAGRSRMAGVYLQDAMYSYKNLGANGYAEFLVKSFPELPDLSGGYQATNFGLNKTTGVTISKEGTGILDIETVLKSSQAISREIRLRDLLSTLMKIIIENAGAQRMVLLLMRGNSLIVQAECLTGTDRVQMIDEVPIDQYSGMAKPVVNYVVRTHEPVILDDAASSGDFANDLYIREQKPKSVLCAPLIQQGKLTGIIYLENNLTHAAFTKERIDLVILLSGQMAISIENALLYENLEEKVKERTRELKEEKDKSENLLLNILPAETAEELKRTGTSKAKEFGQATVLFTDFKNFTRMSEHLNAQELVSEINYCYSAFDNIVSKYGIEKIKTIGDSYMCAGGLPVENKTNPEDALMAALEIRDFMLQEKQKREADGKNFFEIRIGLHTGPVVAGIVGTRKFAYDIWGDTVNIASRMESSGEPGKVNISGSTYELIKEKFICNYRGKMEAKNKGMIDMYFVEHLV